jgi:hypothetical protein
MKLAVHNTGNWTIGMFGQAALGDKRHTDRLIDVAHRAAKHAGKSTARACEGSGALLEGT